MSQDNYIKKKIFLSFLLKNSAFPMGYVYISEKLLRGQTKQQKSWKAQIFLLKTKISPLWSDTSVITWKANLFA